MDYWTNIIDVFIFKKNFSHASAWSYRNIGLFSVSNTLVQIKMTKQPLDGLVLTFMKCNVGDPLTFLLFC